LKTFFRNIFFVSFIWFVEISSAQIKHDSVSIGVQSQKLKGLLDTVSERNGALSLLKDSLSFKSSEVIKKGTLRTNFRRIVETAQISIGYDYGFLPYTLNQSVPGNAFVTEGQIGINILNLPVDVSYFYTTQKNLIGLNNYFRISFNADRYKNNLNSKLNSNVLNYKNQLSNLSGRNQSLLQKMAYADYLSSVSPENWPVDSLDKLNSNIKVDTAGADTLNPKQNYNPKSIKGDTLINVNSTAPDKALIYKNKSDSIRKLYSTYENEYRQTNDSIKQIQSKINEIESHINGSNPAESYLSKLPFYNKTQNIISGIKRFEIGLCYPNHSTFLANNIPVRGVNLEYSKGHSYFAFTYGTTVSSVLFGKNNLEGFLQNVRNTYNYFDFNNVSAGRKIVAAKLGYGTKESSHAFIGILVGKGKASYLPINGTEYDFTTKESNVVIEADLRYKFKRGAIFDFVVGKSSIQGEDLSYNVIKTSFNEIFSNYRSNAVLARLQTNIKATKSSLTLSFRFIDPFFKSYGLGFLRSDNIRYEIKLDQFISKRIKYIGAFRYEEDNLLNILNYKNKFYSLANTLSLKINRRFMLRGTYTPIYRSIYGAGVNYSIKNHITTGVATFNPRMRKANSQLNLIYNYYLIETDSTDINFQNFALTYQINYKSGFKTGTNFSWFRNAATDSLNNNVLLAVVDVGYQFVKGSSILIGAKAAIKTQNEIHPGFIAKVNIKLFKGFFWETHFEKFVIGDLFNGYDLENLKKFPYYCSTRLVLNF